MLLSVIVITLNEEKNIKRCLDSVQNIADDIVVVDSLSTDNTTQIAESCGARVVSQSFLGYVEQRNFSTEQAKYDWVLTLDADEVVTPELEKSILSIKEQNNSNVYQLKRLTNYCGKWIKHSGWYPDKKIRLFDRTKGTWKGGLVHEYWEAHDKNERIETLQGDLLHYTFDTITQHIKQIQKYTDLNARSAADNGKTCSLFKIWFGPKWFFFSRFVLKLGFLDGYYGYLVCRFSAYAKLMKYSKTRQYAELKKRGIAY